MHINESKDRFRRIDWQDRPVGGNANSGRFGQPAQTNTNTVGLNQHSGGWGSKQPPDQHPGGWGSKQPPDQARDLRPVDMPAGRGTDPRIDLGNKGPVHGWDSLKIMRANATARPPWSPPPITAAKYKEQPARPDQHATALHQPGIASNIDQPLQKNKT